MSRANTLVCPSGRMDLALQLIFTPMIGRLVEQRRQALGRLWARSRPTDPRSRKPDGIVRRLRVTNGEIADYTEALESLMQPTTTSISIPFPGRRASWLAIGLAVGLLVAAIASPAFTPRTILGTDPATAPEHTISVSGIGRVLISPDIADLRLGVSVTAKTVKEARDANATSMAAVIDSIKKLGIADKDIQTSTLSLSPVYDYPPDQRAPILTGYNLTNVVAVTIRDLDKAGEVIDGALAAGATTLDSISFRVDDQTAAERQAREAAMAEAKAKAQTLASAAGVSITGVAAISETSAPTPYPVYYGAQAEGLARDVATPVQPGTNEVTVTVAVVYVIG